MAAGGLATRVEESRRSAHGKGVIIRVASVVLLPKPLRCSRRFGSLLPKPLPPCTSRLRHCRDRHLIGSSPSPPSAHSSAMGPRQSVGRRSGTLICQSAETLPRRESRRRLSPRGSSAPIRPAALDSRDHGRVAMRSQLLAHVERVSHHYHRQACHDKWEGLRLSRHPSRQ